MPRMILQVPRVWGSPPVAIAFVAVVAIVVHREATSEWGREKGVIAGRKDGLFEDVLRR